LGQKILLGYRKTAAVFIDQISKEVLLCTACFDIARLIPTSAFCRSKIRPKAGFWHSTRAEAQKIVAPVVPVVMPRQPAPTNLLSTEQPHKECKNMSPPMID